MENCTHRAFMITYRTIRISIFAQSNYPIFRIRHLDLFDRHCAEQIVFKQVPQMVSVSNSSFFNIGILIYMLIIKFKNCKFSTLGIDAIVNIFLYLLDFSLNDKSSRLPVGILSVGTNFHEYTNWGFP